MGEFYFVEMIMGIMDKTYPRPANEVARLAALQALNILGPAQNSEFDDIVELARELFQVPMVAITLIDTVQQYIKSGFGLDVCVMPREASICNYTITRGSLFVIDDLSVDPELRQLLPQIDGQPMCFYAGVPISIEPDLHLGALCIGDVKPRTLTPGETSHLYRLASLASTLLRHRKIVLENETATASLRDQLRKNEEQSRALVRSHKLFDRASALTKIGSWERGIDTREVHWSSGMYDIFEVEAGKILTVDEIFSMFPIGYREKIEQIIDHKIIDQKIFDNEILISTAKGNKRWVRETWNIDRSLDRPDYLFGIIQDITEQKAVWDRMRFLAERDLLTGLPNRSLLQSRLEHLSIGPFPEQASLVLIDLDGFKHINDTFGHDVGDQCLKQIANRLQRSSRSTDVLARMGGDEFALLVHKTDRRAIEARALAILRLLRRPIHWRGKSFQISGSIGIAFKDQLDFAPLHIVTEADLALYAAKAAGRNIFRIFDQDMKKKAEVRFETVKSVTRALQRGELALFYQPKILLAEDKLAGFEALLRWRHPDGRIIAAGALSAALEDPDLSERIGDWVVETALSQARTWHLANLDFGHIAINLSPSQFREVAFADRLIGMIAAHGLRTDMIEVEITEGVFLNPEGGIVREILDKLRTAGIRIALDDFGTGFASLSHLRTYPVDIIKLDRSFIQHVLTSPQDHGIVQATLFLARQLEVEVVAEGIEEQDQFHFLNALGCRYGQGWLFAKALPAIEATTWCVPVSEMLAAS